MNTKLLWVKLKSLLAGCKQVISDLLDKIPIWLLIVILSAMPALLTFVLIRLELHTSLRHFIPVRFNDQISNWLEILTFNRAGFNGGYYSYFEVPPPFRFFHFGVHGPMFTILYGLISKLVGWSYATGIYINMVILGIALGLFAWKSRLDRVQILIASSALLTCWPVLLYLPSIFQETLHQSIGIILASVFYYVIVHQHMTPVSRKIGIVLLLIFVSSIRYSWSLLLLPLLMLISRKTVRQQVLALLSAVILIFGIYYIISLISDSTAKTTGQNLSTMYSPQLADSLI